MCIHLKKINKTKLKILPPKPTDYTNYIIIISSGRVVPF